eukprot:TRINITY_DN9135_c0_g2_i1.p1 TRINITY_DN9135_c0_g2~~TRINITY_DN9135_c0_g2_i1.p1  ORF type:complete len:170 (+),score=35.65 TRINITY_DN9135_c0_g2_i1:104-613(+)
MRRRRPEREAGGRDGDGEDYVPEIRWEVRTRRRDSPAERSRFEPYPSRGRDREDDRRRSRRPQVSYEDVEHDAGVAEAVDYFRWHLLLRPFRSGQPGHDDPATQDAVNDFRLLIQYIKRNAAENGALDLQTFEQHCERFSQEWQHRCHWINWRILSRYLTEKIGVRWRG